MSASNTTTSLLPYGGRLMFTQSWEDPECDLAALQIRAGERVFAITSGGDNIFEFLLKDAGAVVAVDLNPTQTFLLELKRAAFLVLSHGEMLELLGVADSSKGPALSNAPAHYQRCRGLLSEAAAQFFDERQAWFSRGLLLQGGFERYFAVLRQVLSVLVGRRRLSQLFELQKEQQAHFFDTEWNTLRYRGVVRLLCSKWFLSKKLDPSWFQDADAPDLGRHFAELARHALVNLEVRSNYFLAQILTAGYRNDAMPRYLKAEHFDTIRGRVGRIVAKTRDVSLALQEETPGSVDAFALSNVFEYSATDVFEASKDALLSCAAPDARICLRNLVAPRLLREDPRFVVDTSLSEIQRAADRGFIYSRFEAARLA